MTGPLARRDTCSPDNSYNGEFMKYRILSVFVILIASGVGSFLPLLASYNSYFKLPSWCFFVIKYFGSGVIVATGFIHLLAEAEESLNDGCLGGVWESYSWAEGICLMGVFTMFFFDMIAHKKVHERFVHSMAAKKNQQLNREPETEGDEVSQISEAMGSVEVNSISKMKHSINVASVEGQQSPTFRFDTQYQHEYNFDSSQDENVLQQIINSLVLEFGIVFHSVFVGLSLAIAGEEFISLFIAITFHQLLEGLGLGTRFATTKWPEDKPWIPWCLSLCYSFTTPIAIAIGIGIRHTYPPGSRAALITTGVFDAFCGGILIYNSLVELMAYDFIFSSEFKNDPSMSRMFTAFICLSAGAAVMALIGKWA